MVSILCVFVSFLCFFFSSRRRHTRCALVTGVQTCALPISPLASLRVRVEQIEDERLRDKIIASIEEMTAMLADIMALARSGSGNEAREPVALRALVGDLAADYREQGREVVTAEVADAGVVARPVRWPIGRAHVRTPVP